MSLKVSNFFLYDVYDLHQLALGLYMHCVKNNKLKIWFKYVALKIICIRFVTLQDETKT